MTYMFILWEPMIYRLIIGSLKCSFIFVITSCNLQVSVTLLPRLKVVVYSASCTAFVGSLCVSYGSVNWVHSLETGPNVCLRF